MTARRPPVARAGGRPRPVLALAALVTLGGVARPLPAQEAAPPGFQRFMARGRIPAVDDPQFVPAAEADIPADAWVLGVVIDGRARAYSLNLLNAHEVVNDRFGERPVAVMWCPLANAGAAYDRRIAGRELRFETSGVLMHGSIVVQDKETDTFWPLVLGQAAVGPLKGTPLRPLPGSVKTQWKDWRREHPDTLVWSRGGDEHLERSPYQSYLHSPYGHKGLAAKDARLATKDPVYALEHEGRHYAVPFPAFVGGAAFTLGGPLRLPVSPPRRGRLLLDARLLVALRLRPQGRGLGRRGHRRALRPRQGRIRGAVHAQDAHRPRHVLVHLEPHPPRHRGGRGALRARPIVRPPAWG